MRNPPRPHALSQGHLGPAQKRDLFLPRRRRNEALCRVRRVPGTSTRACTTRQESAHGRRCPQGPLPPPRYRRHGPDVRLRSGQPSRPRGVPPPVFLTCPLWSLPHPATVEPTWTENVGRTPRRCPADRESLV